jgi:hypothetical protein
VLARLRARTRSCSAGVALMQGVQSVCVCVHAGAGRLQDAGAALVPYAAAAAAADT